MNTTKIFARRDSATAILRKAGIDKADYNQFIVVIDGQYQVTMNGKIPVSPRKAAPVEVDVKQGDEVANQEEVKAGKAAKAKREPKTPRVTVSTRARELILEGKDNAEVFAVLKEEFNLDDSKKHYPSWYRSELKRAGKIV